jgi:hypothetical protein
LTFQCVFRYTEEVVISLVLFHSKKDKAIRNMQQQSSWRELLDTIIREPSECKRIAEAVGVVEVTVRRWASGQASPRSRFLRPLLQAIPDGHRQAFEASMKEAFSALALDRSGENKMVRQGPVYENTRFSIPSAFVRKILAIRASNVAHQASWVIIQQVLQQAVSHLSSSGLRIKITLVACMPVRENGRVCSLRQGCTLGTSPWSGYLEKHVQFVGAQTLCGQSVATERAQRVRDVRQDSHFLLHAHDEHEVSAAACPLLWYGRVAGCVLFSSLVAGAFESEELMVLLQDYTNLIALAFTEGDFVEVESIQLRVLPTPADQQEHLASFHVRYTQLLSEAAQAGQALSSWRAEILAWQQIETLLLRQCVEPCRV